MKQDEYEMDRPSLIQEKAVSQTRYTGNLDSVRVRYVRHERKRTKYGGHQLTWLVDQPRHELHGKILPYYYPDNGQKGGWSPSSKFAKLWVLFTERVPRRWSRLSCKVFKARYGLAQVTLAQPEVAEKERYFKITTIVPIDNVTWNGPKSDTNLSVQ